MSSYYIYSINIILGLDVNSQCLGLGAKKAIITTNIPFMHRSIMMASPSVVSFGFLPVHSLYTVENSDLTGSKLLDDNRFL